MKLGYLGIPNLISGMITYYISGNQPKDAVKLLLRLLNEELKNIEGVTSYL